MANSNWTKPISLTSVSIPKGPEPSPVAWIKLFFASEEDINLYRYVALTATLIMFHYTMTGFLVPGGARKKAFSPEFLE